MTPEEFQRLSPWEQGKELRQLLLPQLAGRKADLDRMLKSGPASEADYQLLVSVIAFALAEISHWQGENKAGINN